MWVIDEMIKNGIEFTSCPLAIIPFGTGNDFSRTLDWGGKAPTDIVGRNYENLFDLIKHWIQAK